MKKIFLIIFLLFLTGLVVWEEIMVNQALTTIKDKAEFLQARVYDLKAVDNDEVKNSVKEITEIWDKYENYLCFIVNHKDIEDVGMELARLKANCNVNQYEDFCSSISVILFFTEKYSHIMGVSIQNII